jgi:hypothetical protein
LIEQGSWIDRASASMPSMYIFAGTELADVLRATGRAPQASSVSATTTNLAHAVKLDALMTSIENATHAPPSSDSPGVILDGGRDSQPPP